MSERLPISTIWIFIYITHCLLSVFRSTLWLLCTPIAPTVQDLVQYLLSQRRRWALKLGEIGHASILSKHGFLEVRLPPYQLWMSLQKDVLKAFTLVILLHVLFICKVTITVLVTLPITSTKGVMSLLHLHLGTRPDNRQRVASNTRPVNEWKRVVKEEKIVLTDPNLPQLVQEIQEKLVKSSIECMICYDKVIRSANIWSCSSCYSIFHIHCIKRWARAPTSIDLLAEKNQGDNWRCPGCQSVQLTS